MGRTDVGCVVGDIRGDTFSSPDGIGVDPRGVNPAESFYELAEKFFYYNADIVADRRDPTAPANVWYCDESKVLKSMMVPQQIFNELMAMRASEYSMKLGARQAVP